MGVRRAGWFAVVGLMSTLLTGCGGRGDSLSAVGWTSDGDVVLVRDAVLWTGPRGAHLRSAPLGQICHGVTVGSIFALPSPRIGLMVHCGGNDRRVAFVSFDPETGQSEPFAAVSTANLPLLSSYSGGPWSVPDRTAFIGYSTLGCAGVGTVTGTTVHPLDTRVVLPSGTLPLADALPEVAGPGCHAHALARSPSLSPHGRYLAFFMHVCEVPCNGPMPDAAHTPIAADGIWQIVVQDRASGAVTVSAARFRWPWATAVTDEGTLLISAGRDTDAALYQCDITTCDTPTRLAPGRFDSLQIHPAGHDLIAMRPDTDEPIFIRLER